MADQLLAGLPPVLDFNGDVVAGGSVTFYETNTTTPVAIWSDIAATIPLANPLTLDSAGRPSNQIFYVGTVAVKEVIKDAGGATLYTVDPSPRFSVTAAAASGVTYAPIASNPSLNVQDAIDFVSTSSAVFPSIVGNAGKAPFVNGGATAVAYIDSLGYGCTATGTNTISLATGLALNTLADGVTVGWLQDVTNTGAATVEVDNVASAPLVLNNGSAVAAGKLIAGDYYSASYDGTNWVLGAATGIDGTVIGGTTPAAGTFASLTATTADINGGTIDGTVVGATTPAAGTFTALTATGAFTSLGIDDNATSTAITIDASQNVGIGTTSPSSTLELSEDAAPTLTFERTISVAGNGVIRSVGNTGAINAQITLGGGPNDHMTFDTDGAERMRIDASGSVGIGTASPAVTLDVNGRIRTDGGTNFLDIYHNNTVAYLETTGGAATPLGFATNGAERMRVDDSGNVMIGVTVSGTQGGISIRGATGTKQILWARATNATTTFAQEFSTNGSTVGFIAYTNTATTFSTTSDYRIKENITPIQGAGDIVKAMNPVTYTFKSDGTWMDGFLAHEIQTLLPSAVTGEKDKMKDEEYDIEPAEDAVFDADGKEIKPAKKAKKGIRSVLDVQTMDYSRLTPILTAALQEALEKIDDLTARIDVLEAKK